jgi:hypothetical protein
MLKDFMSGVDIAVGVGIIAALWALWNGWTDQHQAWCGWLLLGLVVGFVLVFLRLWLESLLSGGRK